MELHKGTKPKTTADFPQGVEKPKVEIPVRVRGKGVLEFPFLKININVLNS